MIGSGRIDSVIYIRVYPRPLAIFPFPCLAGCLYRSQSDTAHPTMSSSPFLLLSTPLIIAFALSVLVLCTVYGALYRLYLSPLAKFPGPRVATLTFWNEFWYDVVRGGRYTWKIGEYHERYGGYLLCLVLVLFGTSGRARRDVNAFCFRGTGGEGVNK